MLETRIQALGLKLMEHAAKYGLDDRQAASDQATEAQAA
jgi:hypothetical protein